MVLSDRNLILDCLCFSNHALDQRNRFLARFYIGHVALQSEEGRVQLLADSAFKRVHIPAYGPPTPLRDRLTVPNGMPYCMLRASSSARPCGGAVDRQRTRSLSEQQPRARSRIPVWHTQTSAILRSIVYLWFY